MRLSISMRAMWPGPSSVFPYIGRAPQVASQGRFPLARHRQQRVLLDVAKQSNKEANDYNIACQACIRYWLSSYHCRWL